MNQDTELNPVEVFSGTSWEAGMLMSLLKDNEIEAYFQDDNVGSVVPWLSARGESGAIKVVVAAKDYEKAMEVVAKYDQTLH
jgi:hypothetical protein